MKLLFDQNLSFKLCALLADLFPESKSVRELGLDQSNNHVLGLFCVADGLHDLLDNIATHLASHVDSDPR